MSAPHTRPRWISAAAALLAAVTAAPIAVAAPDDRSVPAGSLRLSDASITVKCPLTVGGSFQAETNDFSGELALDASRPGFVTGAVAVDLRTLQTGIALRDEHLRDKYLEAGRGTSYAVSTLDQIRLASGDPAHPKGKTRFEGVLQLHGRKHPVAGTADIRPSGDGLRVEAIFPVSLSDFGIERATYLGVGVADAVTVTVSFKASVPRRP